ncbi:MAG TPA: T6SS immunity protein Tdi1 domain-containing protein [Verrucomicrobiae bacterium]|nr:T6SS immunity protein Tdi1 domain-containing protein [Verrucomicrobiae bacterium]
MAVPKHLTVDIEGFDFTALLNDWQWLLKKSYTPVLMTACGDLFLRDQSGHIHFLDLMCGEIKKIAHSQAEFDLLLEDRGQRRTWFMGNLLMELKKLHGDLPSGKCWGCKVPLTLGGSLEPLNFEPIDVQVHYSVLGQLYRRTKHMPPGTKISSVHFDD